MEMFDVTPIEIYLDNAATTVVDDAVLDAMRAYLDERYGNPETPYRLGREAREAVDDARAKVAELLGCSPNEVYFTSGGTEANNWAIKGHSFTEDKNVVVVGAVEHSSVLKPANWLMDKGIASLYVAPVDAEGTVNIGAIKKYLKDGHVGLVSVQYANNEVGTIQPVDEIAKLCQKYGAMFHCDAVQALGKVHLNVKELGADFVSVSSHKIHGPMGIGALYIRDGAEIEPLLHGGEQEGGLRAGTLAVPQIVGFGKAVELVAERMLVVAPAMWDMTRRLAMDVEQKLDAKVNGSKDNRLPHIVSFQLPVSEAALIAGILADQHGIVVSTGSACATRTRGSHVLEAMGQSRTQSCSAVRVSVSRYTKQNDLVMFVARLQHAVVEAKRRSLL